MGGKGIRRREKNYKAAHGGGNTRLPPPPDPSSLDTLPSKLRKMKSFAGSGKHRFSLGKKNTGDGADMVGISLEEGANSMTSGMKRKRNDRSLLAQHKEHTDEDKKKKKKRKTKTANDLRFKAMDETVGAGSQRKERKKQLLEARKKKNKKAKVEEDVNFPGREEIKFGDVVEAPPKLITVPKAFKSASDASHERLRLQAVEAYRKRKGWESRPGVKLPSPVTTSPFF